MPYDASDVSSLPKNVQEMDEHDRKMWTDIFNSTLEKHGDEAIAFKYANGVLKKRRGEKPTEEEVKGFEYIISQELGAEITLKGIDIAEAVEALDGVVDEIDDIDLEGIILKKFTLDDSNSTEISFRAQSDAASVIPKMLAYIARLGAPGHSFSIVVDPDDSENRRSFGFDGDGSDRIDDIKVNGVKFELEKDY